MAIDAHHLRIVNFSVNPDDASAGLTLSLARFRLNLQQAMNRPNPGKVQPGMSSIAAKRWAPQHPQLKQLYKVDCDIVNLEVECTGIAGASTTSLVCRTPSLCLAGSFT